MRKGGERRFAVTSREINPEVFVHARIQKMSTVLKEKEESVRKLKETLRKSQQEGEDSCKSALCASSKAALGVMV